MVAPALRPALDIRSHDQELDRGVAWVRDLFEPTDVDSRGERAVAVWKVTNDEGVNRSDSVTEWLRR